MLRRARPWLGTIVEIAVAASGVEADDRRSIELGFARIADLHRLMSFQAISSDVSRVNRANPRQLVSLGNDTVAVLRMAMALHEASGGIFNICVGRALVRHGFLPRDGVGHLARYCGTMADLTIVDDNHIRVDRRMLIDLGGIAKGYAVDCAIGTMIGAGVSSGIVNAGGDLRIFGPMRQPVAIRFGSGRYADLGLRGPVAIASSENRHLRKRLRGQLVTPHVDVRGESILIDEAVVVTAATCMAADALTKVAMVSPLVADGIAQRHGGQLLYPVVTSQC